jgi:ubiquitin-protein ligase
MGPRKQVRLQKDHEELLRLKRARPELIDFTAIGNPPTEYQFTCRLKGVQLDATGEKAIATEVHRFTLRLGSYYPSEPPDVTWQTPIFHPNIRGQAVCHSQQWSPAWSLADFVIEIGDMIRMDKFNVKSPLDRKAAAWADKNRPKFPLDERSLRPPEMRISIKAKPGAAPGAPSPSPNAP